MKRNPECDADWSDLAIEFQIRPDTTYLNHGSFGPPPNCVRLARREWIARLDEQPMDFYVRQFEDHWYKAMDRVADFLGARPADLVFVENCTYGMNIIADSFPLKHGDQVLLNNHEYGAVHRIWNRRAERAGAQIVSAKLPQQFESEDQIVECLLSATTDKTRLVVVSHITSATALIMPVDKICHAFHERGIAVCIDGPHAPAQVPLDISKLDCDFYTASCHKWMCGSLGSGFLFVHPRWHAVMQPPIKAWGRLLPAVPESWDEEFIWQGTRDPSPFLSLPTAIEFMQRVGLDSFRQRAYGLAGYAEQKLIERFGTTPIGNRNAGWYGTMAHVPLPAECDWSHLQDALWDKFQIEVPVINFDERWFVRVSCHLYTNRAQIDQLDWALEYFSHPSQLVKRVV